MKIQQKILSLKLGDRGRLEAQIGEVYTQEVLFLISKERLKIFVLYYWPALELQPYSCTYHCNSIATQSTVDAGMRRREKGQCTSLHRCSEYVSGSGLESSPKHFIHVSKRLIESQSNDSLSKFGEYSAGNTNNPH